MKLQGALAGTVLILAGTQGAAFAQSTRNGVQNHSCPATIVAGEAHLIWLVLSRILAGHENF